MRRLIVLIFLLLVVSPYSAEAFQLLWDPVTTNSDGTIITDLAAYVAYYRTRSTTSWVLLGEVGASATTVTVEPGQVGEYVLRARNVAGIESEDSNVVVVKKPGKVTVTGVVR